MAETAHFALERRSRLLRRDLASVESMLERIDGQYSDRVRHRVLSQAATIGAEARDLLECISRPEYPTAGAWAWLHALQVRVGDFNDEVLRLVVGAAARTIDLDNGYCAISDMLVDELVRATPIEHWGSFSILGSSEQFSRPSRIIEVKAPSPSVWELPVVAHELGHFVGPALVRESGLRSVHPLDALYDELGDGTGQSWSWMQELFADVFAAYVLGPAYGFTCCLDVLDPLLSCIGTDTHPPAEQRIRVIAATLRRSGSERSIWAADQIELRWQGLVSAAGGADGLVAVGDSAYADRLITLVENDMPISRWDGWASLSAIEEELRANVAAGQVKASRIADILNAAWLARLGECTRAGVDDLGNRTRGRLELLAQGGG